MPCPVNAAVRRELASNRGLTPHRCPLGAVAGRRGVAARLRACLHAPLSAGCHQPLELLEALAPAVPVKRQTRLSAEIPLPQRDLRRVAPLLERQIDQRLDIVRIGRLPSEREREAGGRVHGAEHAVDEERLALGRLHLDAIGLTDQGAEVDGWDREPSRPPPLGESRRIPERSEGHRPRRRQDAPHLEDECVRTHTPSVRRRGYLMTAIVSPAEIAAPSATPSSSTVPAAGAVISFSIFIASITQISAPASTAAPFSTATLSTVPCSGETSLPSADGPLPPPERSRRFGAFLVA